MLWWMCIDPVVCRSLPAFLLSVCMSVWSMSSICTSPVVCCLFLSGMLIHVGCCVSHLLSFSRVCRRLVFGRHTVLWHLLLVPR